MTLVSPLDAVAQKMAQSLPVAQSLPTMDVVIDGGLFNGSYAIGVMHLLRAMEHQGLVRVQRISGASVGSIVGLLYLCDALPLAVDSYERMVETFRRTSQLHTYRELRHLAKSLPADFLPMVQGKLYISYYDLKTLRKITRSTFRSQTHVLRCVARSSFIPMLTHHPHFLCQRRYVDGIMPALFPPGTLATKTLYIDLHSNAARLIDCFRVKHEQTNVHRIMYGMVDAYTFFAKGKSETEFCRYHDALRPKWSLTLKQGLEKLFFLVLVFLVQVMRLVAWEKVHHSVWTQARHCFGLFCQRYIL